MRMKPDIITPTKPCMRLHSDRYIQWNVYVIRSRFENMSCYAF